MRSASAKTGGTPEKNDRCFTLHRGMACRSDYRGRFSHVRGILRDVASCAGFESSDADLADHVRIARLGLGMRQTWVIVAPGRI
jgi:hypothetical protein